MEDHILISNQNLKLDPPHSSAFTLQLCQLEFDIDSTTRTIRDGDLHWMRLLDMLRRIAWPIQETCILVLPECSIPASRANEFTAAFIELASLGSIAIAGLETMPVQDLIALAANGGWILPPELAYHQSAQIPVNAALIIVKSADGAYRCTVQPKLTHSKFEASLYEGSSVFEGSTLWYFHADHFSFVVLICSDLFTRPHGSTLRLADYVDYQILKSGSPVDFLFNIQFNPSPDHPLFQESLNRLFDDGYQKHGGLTAVLLNACISNRPGSGRSKILVHGMHQISPLLSRVVQFNAPVRGVDFGPNPGCATVKFDRLPKQWDLRRDHCAIHCRFHDPAGVDKPEALASVVDPTRGLADHSPVAVEDFINRIATEGEVTKALDLVEQLRNEHLHNGALSKAAHAAYLGGRIARNALCLEESLKNFADAESLLRRIHRLNSNDRVLLWRVESARIWLEKYILKADVKHALADIRDLIESQHKWLQSSPTLSAESARRVSVSILHDKRKEAELLIVRGRYTSAEHLASQLYRAYSYGEAESKAYAALLVADARRLLDNAEEATSNYEEVENYARDTGNTRLVGRTLRSKIENCRQRGLTTESALDELESVSKKADYRFGLLYGALIRGTIALATSPSEAERYFNRAEELATVGNHQLELEISHALFGRAEAERLRGQTDQARALYNETLRRYRFSGMRWGEVRSRIGLVLTGPSLELPLRGDGPLGQKLISRVSSGEFRDQDTLLDCIP